MGGPSAVGKTTLIEKMRQGDVPNLCEQLSIEQSASTFYLEARQLCTTRLPVIVEQLVLHYDFVRQVPTEGIFPYLTDLINKSYSVRACTLCTASCVLHQRINSRLKKALISFLKKPKKSRVGPINYLWTTRALYQKPLALFTKYNEWSACIEKLGVTEHLIMDPARPVLRTAEPYEKNKAKELLIGVLRQELKADKNTAADKNNALFLYPPRMVIDQQRAKQAGH